jgi:hypothetical protein
VLPQLWAWAGPAFASARGFQDFHGGGRCDGRGPAAGGGYGMGLVIWKVCPAGLGSAWAHMVIRHWRRRWLKGYHEELEGSHDVTGLRQREEPSRKLVSSLFVSTISSLPSYYDWRLRIRSSSHPVGLFRRKARRIHEIPTGKKKTSSYANAQALNVICILVCTEEGLCSGMGPRRSAADVPLPEHD